MSCNSPTQADLCFKLWETWSVVVTCKNRDGSVIDLTGALSAKWRVASVNGDGTLGSLLIDAGIGSGIEISGTPTTGVLTIGIPKATQQAANLAPGSYRHELQIIPADGAPSTQMEGDLTVTESLFSHTFA